jgi:dTDP-glucose 4,6-dehydratase
LQAGKVGEVYNVGGWNEMANIEVVKILCRMLDAKKPRADRKSYLDQITFVQDRLGHDQRYAIDATKISNELGWKPAETFESGIEKTVNWYLENQAWVHNVTSGEYRHWVEKHYAERGEELA